MTYYNGANDKVYALLPPSQNVLELGPSDGLLKARYLEAHPDACWTMIPDPASLPALERGFECVVVRGVLERSPQPLALLETLADVSTPDATLVCSISNMGHISVIERMLMGDLSYDEDGLLDRKHSTFLTSSSAFKLLLDSGWLPALRDRCTAVPEDRSFAAHILEGAKTLGIPRATAENYLFTYQALVHCRKWADRSLDAPLIPISVIVPVTSDVQTHLNVLTSPGLREIGAQIVLCRNAASAADAYASALRQVASPWVVFCHQDVYFPKGSGRALCRALAQVPDARTASTVVGFAGLGHGEGPTISHAGLVVDRTALFDHSASASAISIDEFAVVLHRDSRLLIDPALGWHLWATDLCLQAMSHPGGTANCRIARVPLFHNSFNDWTLPPAFAESAGRLAAKYPQLPAIPTLCGTISRG